MKNIAKDFTIFKDGTMEVEIEFNPFEHGHKLGAKRNYNASKYRQMVENKTTQTHIANGYALGTFSHDFRGSNGTLKTIDNNGKPIIPICKTLSMKWNEDTNTVTHKQRILNNEMGKEIQTLIKNGIGGFSSAHNLISGEFYGFDYVTYPNFSTNRVIVDNACKNGMCSFDEVQMIKQDLQHQIDNYLQQIGYSGNDNIGEILVNLELNRESTSNNITIAQEVKKLKSKVYQVENVFDNINKLKKKYDNLVLQIKENGLVLDDANENIIDANLSQYFKSSDINDLDEIDDDLLKVIPLKKVLPGLY